MGTNHYICIVSRVQLQGSVVPARLIAERLLEQNVWLFSAVAPFRNRLAPGDKALVYLAGPGERAFIGTVELASCVREASEKERGLLEDLGLVWFDMAADLKNVALFDQPVPIAPLVTDLEFIGNKRFYGHYLRQAVAAIGSQDYARITQRALTSRQV